MQTKKKQTQIFFTESDEMAFFNVLKDGEHALSIVDGNVWEGDTPPIKDRIEDCQENIVFLWNQRIFPKLPTVVRSDGKQVGPTSGVVIQLVRSRFSESLLLSGRIATGYDADNKQFEAFVKSVFKALVSFSQTQLIAVDPNNGEVINERVTGYAVGPDAAVKLATGAISFLRDRSTQNFFLPKSVPPKRSNQ